jgi:hypothetical protein
MRNATATSPPGWHDPSTTDSSRRCAAVECRAIVSRECWALPFGTSVDDRDILPELQLRPGIDRDGSQVDHQWLAPSDPATSPVQRARIRQRTERSRRAGLRASRTRTDRRIWVDVTDAAGGTERPVIRGHFERSGPSGDGTSSRQDERLITRAAASVGAPLGVWPKCRSGRLNVVRLTARGHARR